MTSDHNRTVYQELAEHLSGDSLTYFHASEHVMYLLIACIIIIATFFDSCAFICGSDSVNGGLITMCTDPAETVFGGSCLAFAFTSSVARLVGIGDEIDKP